MNVIKEFTVANNCVITLKAVTFVPVHQGMNWKGALTAKVNMLTVKLMLKGICISIPKNFSEPA